MAKLITWARFESDSTIFAFFGREGTPLDDGAQLPRLLPLSSLMRFDIPSQNLWRALKTKKNWKKITKIDDWTKNKWRKTVRVKIELERKKPNIFTNLNFLGPVHTVAMQPLEIAWKIKRIQKWCNRVLSMLFQASCIATKYERALNTVNGCTISNSWFFSFPQIFGEVPCSDTFY